MYYMNITIYMYYIICYSDVQNPQYLGHVPLVLTTQKTTGAGRLEQSHRLVRGGCVSSGDHRPAEGSSNEELWFFWLGVTMAIIYRYG